MSTCHTNTFGVSLAGRLLRKWGVAVFVPFQARSVTLAIRAGFCLLMLLGRGSFAPQCDAFTIYFDKSAYSGDVWIQAQVPTGLDFDVTYANGSKSIDVTDPSDPTKRILMSAPVKLSDIGEGGLLVNTANSAIFYVFYEDPTPSDSSSSDWRKSAPAHMTSKKRFQPFEVTMRGPTYTSDQGNMTSINYFTAPLGLRTYEANGAVIEEKGWGANTAAKIGALMAAASNGNADAVVLNDEKKIIRYLGPSNTFVSPKTNPWPNFISYVSSIPSTQTAHIVKQNAFVLNGVNYQFGCDMYATSHTDGTVRVSGDITVNITAGTIEAPNPSPPESGKWTGAVLTFTPSNASLYKQAIYGQAINDAILFDGATRKADPNDVTRWDNLPDGAFKNFLQFTKDTHKIDNHVVQPETLFSDRAFDTTMDLFIGEVTGGLLFGFFNTPAVVGGVAIKDQPSSQWYTYGKAFEELQPSNVYYNPYAEVIYKATGNTVYGLPYSDRFPTGPLVNTVKYGNKDVAYAKVFIGEPLPGSAPGANVAPTNLLLNE